MIASERKLWVPKAAHHTFDQYLLSTADKENEIKALFAKFSEKAPQKSLWCLCCNSLVVGQEFVLSCLLLAGHRVGMLVENEHEQWRQVASILAVSVSLIIILRCSETSNPSQKTMKMRGTDAILLAGILRLLSAVLKTLTASYSSDTVHALAAAGMVVHLLFCDYSYANGISVSNHTTQGIDCGRKPFMGGTFSLNAALFSTTLLASRLSSNSIVYVFVSSSVLLFAFYPAARHAISNQTYAPYISFSISTVLSLTLWVLLRDMREKIFVTGITLTICVLAPVWKHHIQSKKVIISGPWDIVQIISVDNNPTQTDQ